MTVDMFLKLARGNAKSEATRTWRKHWEAALWGFAIVAWGAVAHLYHSHPSFP